MDTTDKNKPAAPTADLDEQALFYHRYPRPGKLEIQAKNISVRSRRK